MTWSTCHCGSDWLAGSHRISSLNTTSPSITAAALRSLAPRSKPIRQPSRWRPRATAASRSGGNSASGTPTTSNGTPNSLGPMNAASKMPVGSAA